MGLDITATWECDWCDRKGRGSNLDPRTCLVPAGWWLSGDGQLFCPDCIEHKGPPPPLSADAAAFYEALMQAECAQAYVPGAPTARIKRLVRELSRQGVTVGVVFGEHAHGAVIVGHKLGGNLTINLPRPLRTKDHADPSQTPI